MKNGFLTLLVAAVCCSAANAQRLKSGIDPKGFDKTVRVQDDLFMHVNGEWIKHVPIPADKSNYGSFTVLVDEAQLNIRTIIEAVAERKNQSGTNAQKVGDFFKSYMNEALIEERGLEPLRDEIAKIARLKNKDNLLKHFGYLQSLGVNTPIGLWVDQDDKNSSRYLTAIMQSGTTLPDRDYYLEDGEKYVKARNAMKTYIERLFQLSEFDGGAAAATAIVALETELARAHWTRTELRNAEKRYNKYAVDKLPELMSEFPWETFFELSGVGGITEINVVTPSFFEQLAKTIDDTPLDVWQQYLRFQLIDSYASVLPKTFVDASFELYQKELAGIPQQKPRWKRAVNATAGTRGFGVLGDAVGQIYVEKHFTADAKTRMDQLVKNLLVAFGKSIDELSWMTTETKGRAREKLSKITTKIGYTEKWRDYSALVIDPNDLIGNVMRSSRVEHHRNVSKLGKPVDRTEWGMTPQTVNAYYNPSMNEIVFPAAILQPPFFDANAEDAVNYGGIGAVIGHEISHAFDDQGSKYDGDGNLDNWWTEKDQAAFTRLTRRLIAQYSAYSPLPDKSVNGQLTLGENIADLSGMAIAHKAYRLSLADGNSPTIDGWTGDQRFFLGWGQIWRRKYRDAEMVRRLLVDPHSPSSYRGNGPLTNIDAFYKAFQLKPGDRLYKPAEQRIRIW